MQGWFDVEVQAKTIRGELQRTAERQRMIDEALGRGRYASNGHEFSLARWLGNARAWLVGQRPSDTAAVERALPEPANISLIVTPKRDAPPHPRPVASSEFYSGMIVLARGKQTRPLEESSSARER